MGLVLTKIPELVPVKIMVTMGAGKEELLKTCRFECPSVAASILDAHNRQQDHDLLIYHSDIEIVVAVSRGEEVYECIPVDSWAGDIIGFAITDEGYPSIEALLDHLYD
jgi:hypothetical protein